MPETSAPSVKKPKPLLKSGKKRGRSPAVSDSDEVYVFAYQLTVSLSQVFFSEVIETPKTKRHRPPAPASPEFALQSPVTITLVTPFSSFSFNLNL